MDSQKIFRRARTVRAQDCDVLGHVNNLRWARWVIELAEAHAAALGYPFAQCHAQGRVWVVHKQRLEYVRGARAGDALSESTWLTEVHAARALRRTQICTAGAGGAPCLNAETHWAFVDVATLRPRRIPPEMRARLAAAARC